MIHFERTRDYEQVRRVMTHPALYPWIADDFHPSAEDFLPMRNEAILYLLAYADGELLGLYITHPINPLLWEVHHCLLPQAWGARALAVGRAYEAWMWQYTTALKIIGFTPASNVLAVRYAKKLGMKEAGRLTRCYQRAGEVQDLVIFEKTKA